MYSDVAVVSEDSEFDPRDRNRLTVTNPRLIVEVLSPETERADRGEKFWRYRELQSLWEYVLVSQHRPEVQTYLRQAS